MSRRKGRTKNESEETNLREQVNVLTSENERLKAILAKHGLANALTSDARIPDEENVAKHSRKSLHDQTSNVASVPPLTPKSKGCSCKGNCSTRVCGCVKKNVPCAEFCRCSDSLCQNQEPDKENIGDPRAQAQLSKEGQENLDKLAQLSLKESNGMLGERATPPVNKQTRRVNKQRSLFSPGSVAGSVDFDITEHSVRSMRFGDDSENESAETSKETTDKPERSGRENLKVTKPGKKRSLSNREEADRSKKSGPKRSLSVDAARRPAADKKGSKNLASLINGPKTSRRGNTSKAGKSRAVQNKSHEDDNGPHEEEPEETNKQGNVTRRMNGRKKKNNNVKSKDEERSSDTEQSSPSETSHANEMADTSEEQVKTDASADRRDDDNEKSATKADNDFDVENVVVKIEIDNDEINEQSGEEQTEQPPNGSETLENLRSEQTFPEALESESFDPMKPRHNLSRSPVVRHNEYRPHPTLDVSERPLPIPVHAEPVPELPPPQELNEAVVDWAKHQAELVYCRKCGRGFYPYRINKHEASCLKM